MNNLDKIEFLARELETLKILEILKGCETLEEAIEKLTVITESK